MKIALCVGNLASRGRHTEKAYISGYNHIKENILDKYQGEVDVFLHSYEPELKDELIKLYQPKLFLFEEQKLFYNEYSLLEQSIYPTNGSDTYQTIFSMCYSRFIVNNLKTQFSIENNVKYDWVIFVRYDLATSHIHGIFFDKNYDNNYIYTSFFDQINAGPADHWFYGNEKNMNTTLSLYLNFKEYFSTNSTFIETAKNGWIDSNVNNRFTCELLFGNNSKIELEKIPTKFILNAHLLYKWHFYKNNLWSTDKIKFIIAPKESSLYSHIPNHENLIKI